MKRSMINRLAIAAIVLAGATSAYAADPFPNKPIHMIVHSAPGGLLDAYTRAVAVKMGESLGQPVVVENRAGAAGLVAFRSVKSAPADGYTVLSAASTFTIQPANMNEPGFDPVKDYVGVGGMMRSPSLVLVPASSPAKNLADFMANARANPGKADYASAGVGSATHLGAASFAQRAGLKLVHVPYKGNAAAWPDLVGGRVGMLFEPFGTAAPMMREGRVRALGATSATRLAALPDVPTIAEQGLPNWTFYLWFGMVAPAGTPNDAVQKLSDALKSALASPDIRERFARDGAEAMPMSPAEFSQFLKGETAVWAKLVSDLGLPKQ